MKLKIINMILVHVITPLVIGGILYMVFRTNSLKMFSWFDYIGINTQISFLREYAIPLKSLLPSWVYFSLPDGLWVYSFTSIILLIWGGEINYWLIIPFTTGILFEVMQGFSFIGTFDWIDLIFSIFGFFFSIIINNKNKNHAQVL